jgi:mRNA interferase RelE/StbE
VRQRLARLIDGLASDPRPAGSRALRLPDSNPAPDWSLHRLRLDDWRVIYAIHEPLAEVVVLRLRRRPPYDYEDLERLLA